jgi:hypothetical protein
MKVSSRISRIAERVAALATISCGAKLRPLQPCALGFGP